MIAKFFGKPADDRHPAVVPIVVDEGLAAEVVVEVDLVPGFTQAMETLFGRGDPNRFRKGVREG
jgi:hypothetical protein